MLKTEEIALPDDFLIHSIESPAGARLGTFNRLPIVSASGGNNISFGKGITAQARVRSAGGEWVERHILRAITPDLHAAEGELGELCLSPILFGTDLALERPDRVLSYDPNHAVGWVRVTSLNGDERLMHFPGWNEEGFYRPTSNGAAVHADNVVALESAVAELLERDAFVRWWYGFTTPIPVTNYSMEFADLSQWFADRGWRLRAFILPGITSLPVSLVIAGRRNASGEPIAALVGLGTASGEADPIAGGTLSAALEVLQAVEEFTVLRLSGNALRGDLVKFLTPSGAAAVERLLPQSPAYLSEKCDWSNNAVEAARSAGIAIWRTRMRCARLGTTTWSLTQVFSPDTLPFPLAGKGRRLNHPKISEYLAQAGRGVSDLPSLPHPLG